MRTNVEDILNAMATLLTGIAVGRKVTRRLQNFSSWPEADREGGVFTILPGPRTGYDYEIRPGDLPKVQIFVYGERHMGEDPGELIDAEEDAMAAQLEQLANDAPGDDLLCELVLSSIVVSSQMSTPFAQVFATFTFGVDR